MSIAVSLSTACIVGMCAGISVYAWISASSSTLRDDSSPTRIEILPRRVMFVCDGSITIPKEDDALVVLAFVTDPSDELYIVRTSALLSRFAS